LVEARKPKPWPVKWWHFYGIIFLSMVLVTLPGTSNALGSDELDRNSPDYRATITLAEKKELCSAHGFDNHRIITLPYTIRCSGVGTSLDFSKEEYLLWKYGEDCSHWDAYLNMKFGGEDLYGCPK